MRIFSDPQSTFGDRYKAMRSMVLAFLFFTATATEMWASPFNSTPPLPSKILKVYKIFQTELMIFQFTHNYI